MTIKDFYRWADAEWNDMFINSPNDSFPAEYVQGFKDGFVDYLYAGGSGEPPVIPPRRFWKSEYRTPEGNQTVHDWFDGFRHGAELASLGGYRDVITVPSSLLMDGNGIPSSQFVVPAGHTTESLAKGTGPAVEVKRPPPEDVEPLVYPMDPGSKLPEPEQTPTDRPIPLLWNEEAVSYYESDERDTMAGSPNF